MQEQDPIVLDDKKRSQLDGNIRKMLEGGASNEDVVKYASDFKTQFGSKKKVQTEVPTTFKDSGNGLKLSQSKDFGYGLGTQDEKGLIQEKPKQPKAKEIPYNDVYTQLNGSMVDGIDIDPNRDNLRETTKEEIAHAKLMDSSLGKVLGNIAYVGSKASKGVIDIAKGANGLIKDFAKGTGDFEGIIDDYEGATDKGFQALDKATQYGLTQGDVGRIEDNGMTGKIMQNVGGVAEFAPTGAISKAMRVPQFATFFLQSLGAAKDETEKLRKAGTPLDPTVEKAYEYANGAIGGLLFGELGNSMFGKMPSGLRKDVISALSADVIKQGVEKNLTGAEVQSLLKKGINDLGTKSAQTLYKMAESGTHAMKTLGALNVGTYAIKEGADKLNSQEVFKQKLGDLTDNLMHTVGTAAMFGLAGGAGSLSKLSKYSGYKNAVVESLMKEPTSENLMKVKEDLADIGREQGWSEKEIEDTVNQVDNIGNITAKLKATEQAVGGKIPSAKLVDAVDLVNGRTELQEQLKTVKEGAKDIDESVKDVKNPNEQFLVDKIDQANDKLNDLITGKKTKYIYDNEADKYFKEKGGERTAIDKSRYELEEKEKPYVDEAKHEAEEIVMPKQESESTEEVNPAEQPTNSKETETASETIKTPEKELNKVRVDSDEIAKSVLHKGIKEQDYKSVEDYEKYFGDKDIYRIAKDSGLKVVELTDEMKKENPMLDGSAGKYIYDNTITIDPKYLGKDDNGRNVLQHEAAHAFTVSVLLEKDASKLNQTELNFKSEIAKAFKENKTKVLAPYGLKNELEFVAEFYGNEKFRKYLKNEDLPLWRKIFKLIGGVLKVDNSRLETIFTDFKQSFLNENETRKSSTESKDVEEVSTPKTEEAVAGEESVKNKENVTTLKEPVVKREADTNAEVIQPAKDDGGGNAKEAKRTATEKVAEIEVKRQSIKDRISEKLKSQRENLNTGIDPTLLKDFIELGATYIEEGVVNAKEFIKRFREDYKELGFDDKDLTDVDIQSQVFDKLKQDQQKADIKEIGLTKEDVQNLRAELGKEQFEYEVRSNAERIAEAKRRIDEGYNIKELVNKLKGDKNFFPDNVEVEILKQYYSSLTERINKEPTPELLKERDEILKSIDAVKVEQGRAIQAWDGLTALEDNLANFLTDESQFVDLTTAQIKDLTAKYEKAKETIAQLNKLQQEALNKAKNRKAESEVEKAKKEALKTGNKKLVSEAYKNERKVAFEGARAALKKVNGQFNAVILPYQAQLIAIAPYVRTIMKSYVSEGVYELKEIVKKIHDEFKDDMPDLTENDVRDIIAGEHRNPKQTKNAKLAQIRDLERQAKLEKKIEDLNNGILETKNPVVKRQKNAEIEALEEEIKQIKKRNPELTEPSRLENRKTWLKNRIAELQDQIKKGEYEPIEPPTPVLLDAEALKLKDEYIKFKEETRERRAHNERKSMTKTQKALDLLQQGLATRRLIQTSIDLSIPFRQGISVMLNPRTAGIGGEAYAKMVKGTFSEKQYDRMMFDIEQNPKYLESKDDGIVYSEVGSLNNEKRDEFHRDHFLYHVPVLKNLLLGSERAAAGWSNYARFELYLRGAMMLEAQGKTRANSKEAYEQLADRVMVDTGRGKIPFVKDKGAGETDGRIKNLLGQTFYGARLMSAIFRKLDPTYYFNPKIDKSVRMEALKDMAGYITGLAAIAGTATQLGYKMSFDQDDPDFLKLRKGKEVIDISGGMATYIRTFLRLVKMAYLQADQNTNAQDANKYSSYAAKSLSNFFRNKLAPNTSYIVNGLTGTNSLGEKFNPYEIIQMYPMYTKDIKEALERGSPLDLATIIPISMAGLGYQTYEKDLRRAKLSNYLDKEKDAKVVSFLKSKQLNLSSDVNQDIYNVEKGDKQKMTQEQADKYEKLWSEYIIDELKDGKTTELSKLDDKKLKKEINSIKFEANRYAKSQITGVAEGVNTIKDDDKTYELTPEQVKERVKLIREFMKDDGQALKEDYTEQFIEEGMSKIQAQRKASVKALNKANSYSRIQMLSDEKDKDDGKVSFKEKEDK